MLDSVCLKSSFHPYNLRKRCKFGGWCISRSQSLALQMLRSSLPQQYSFLRVDNSWLHPSLVGRNGIFLDLGKQDTRWGWFAAVHHLHKKMENISSSLQKCWGFFWACCWRSWQYYLFRCWNHCSILNSMAFINLLVDTSIQEISKVSMKCRQT